ncbi:MAG TPA: chemotaxis protein CheW [Rhizomicrobium sp.]|jgi:purine-binding chemotaxis protein CheW
MSRDEEIFAERARIFAAPAYDANQEARLDLIAFEVGAQKVAIEARYIHAIIPAAEPTPVPGVPDILAGVINFRGGILPVFRLERLLGAGEAQGFGCTIVLGEHRPEFAFFAHTTEEVTGLSAECLRAVPWHDASSAPPSLGVSDGALNVLDGRALLSDRRFYAGRNAAVRE